MKVNLSIRERIDFALYTVEKAAYESYRIDLTKPYWTVSFVKEGEVETRSQGRAERASSGDVMIHPPNVPFTEMAKGRGVHLWMLIDVKIVPNLPLFQRFPVVRVLRLTDPQEYADTFEKLLSVWEREPSPVRDYQAISLGFQLLGLILASWEAAGSATRPEMERSEEDRFLEVIAYMEEHLGEKMTRDDLAQRMHLHPSYFNRIFKKAYGMSSVQMLKAMRLKKAMQLLEDPNYTLERIAAECGFGDAPHLSKVFRENVGMTPGEYRKSIKTTKEGFASFSLRSGR